MQLKMHQNKDFKHVLANAFVAYLTHINAKD